VKIKSGTEIVAVAVRARVPLASAEGDGSGIIRIIKKFARRIERGTVRATFRISVGKQRRRNLEVLLWRYVL